MMMQADKYMLVAMGREYVTQVGQRSITDASGGAVRHPRIEHHDEPSSELAFASHLKRVTCELRFHVIREIVIAGQTHHRHLRSAEDVLNPAIACGVVLHQIASQKNAVRVVTAPGAIDDCGLKRW
jgi:hypothetical protein